MLLILELAIAGLEIVHLIGSLLDDILSGLPRKCRDCGKCDTGVELDSLLDLILNPILECGELFFSCEPGRGVS